jgi:putative sigma-54 modulation protein
MNQTPHDVIISGVHLDLTEALKAATHDKVAKLFRHENHIIRLRVELEYDRTAGPELQFIAKGHLAIYGPDLNVAVSSDDLYKSIDMMVSKLDRMLRRRSRLRKVKRKQPHEVDIPAELPKVSVA